jgi:uncharacterized protein YchJ
MLVVLLQIMRLPVILALLCIIRGIESLEVLDLAIDGLPNRVFPNVSLGLRYNDETTCKWKGESMTYTPNRRVQDQTVEDGKLHRLQLGVVLVVGGHSDRYYDYGPAGSINGLMAVWDSWLENFFTYTSNTTSLVLLFDERDFKKQNYTQSTHTYLDNILIHNMGAEPVDCVHLRHRPGATLEAVYNHQSHLRHPHTAGHLAASPFHQKRAAGRVPRIHRDGCSNELALDQGYRVYYIDVANATINSINQKPLIIYAAVHKFPLAEWVKPEEEENLFKTWKPWRLPGRFPTNYAYVKMTNWYSYHMLNLKILDFFDYAGKLDNDVSFVAPFPEPNLPLRLAAKDTKMMVTQNGWYYDDPRVAQGVHQCLTAWTAEQSKLCKSHGISHLTPRGKNDPTFWESNLNATFRAHFLTFWLGLYTAPETYSLARYWNDWHPRGMWDYRWGDQQWWPRPISMFGTGNVSQEIDHYDEINTDNNKYLVHKLWPRYGTISKAKYFNEAGSTKQDRDAVYAVASKPFIY